jgi:methionyl-tRNA synthetase
MSRKLVTSALPYANGPLHIGHVAGVYLPSDIYVRYLRLRKEDVIHICGSDEHGVAITIAAEKGGISPQKLVDFYHEDIKRAFDGLLIHFDNYSRTSLPVHHEGSSEFFKTLYDKGYVYRKDIQQFYCETCAKFMPDRYIDGTCPHCGFEEARGDQCEDCGRWLEPTDLKEPRCSVCEGTPVLRDTFHYYFKLKEFEPKLREWLEDKGYWKENVRTAALSWIKEGLRDRPITRDLPWGVKVPLEGAEGKVLYVWFEAPIGYISSTIEWARDQGDEELWKDYWLDDKAEIIHFLAKDNIVFHAIIWPAMLMGHGRYSLPHNIPGNEFLNLHGKKLSTSRGWIIEVNELLKDFPADYVRFGLANAIPETKDSDFNFHDFQRRINNELADIYGNFVNRTLSFAKNYLDGRIAPRSTSGEEDTRVLEALEAAPGKIGGFIENFEFRKGLREIMELAAVGNRYFDYQKPWETRKSDPEAAEKTIFLCASMVRALATLSSPFLPGTSERIREMLGLSKLPAWDDSGKPIQESLNIGDVSILFEKLPDETIELQLAKLGKRTETHMPEPLETISFDDFMKLDIRIGKVLHAERVAGTDKLMKIQVNVGDRTVEMVAGIADRYAPDDIIGKQMPILVNLEPKTIRGILSQGMILAATEGGSAVLIHPDKDVDPGAKVR